MLADLTAGEAGGLRGVSHDMLLEAQERGGLCKRENGRRSLPERGSSYDETVVGEMLAHGRLDKLALALADAVTACSRWRVSSRQDNERVLRAGEIVAFPAGPGGTHQVLNRSDTSARLLICATNDVPDVAEQVEHEQLAIITADGLRLAPATEPIAQEQPRRTAP